MSRTYAVVPDPREQLNTRLDVSGHCEVEVLAIRTIAVVAVRAISHVGSSNVEVLAAICREAHLAGATEVVAYAADIEVLLSASFPSSRWSAIWSAYHNISMCSAPRSGSTYQAASRSRDTGTSSERSGPPCRTGTRGMGRQLSFGWGCGTR